MKKCIVALCFGLFLLLILCFTPQTAEAGFFSGGSFLQLNFGRRDNDVVLLRDRGRIVRVIDDRPVAQFNFGVRRARDVVLVRDHAPRAVVVRQPVFVNSQLLVDRHRRLQLNLLNGYGHAPHLQAANIRFIDQGLSYVNTAPIVAAPIIQRLETSGYRQPAAVIVEPRYYIQAPYTQRARLLLQDCY